MANNLIPDELNALIQQYLTDGVLTDKERQVILNKAEKLGLNRDEIDLYLDAEVQKVDQATDAAVRRQKGKQCPYCGGSVPQLTDKCPHCGENITPEASKDLEDIFENLEEALVNLKSGDKIRESKATVERYARKAKMYYSNNPQVQKLLEEIELDKVLAAKEAKTLVRNQNIMHLLEEHSPLLMILISFAAFGILGWYTFKPDPTEDPAVCVKDAIEAVKNGNLSDAEAICAGFSKGSDREAEKIIDAYSAICHAYVEQGNFERAISLIGGKRGFYDFEMNLRSTIQEKCINSGNYDDADKYTIWYLRQSDYYDFICKCIDHMKKNGKSAELKSFIDRKVVKFQNDPNYKEWSPEIVKPKLYEYAGVN